MHLAEEAIQDSEITWLVDYSICSKKLKHYQAFSRKGNTVSPLTLVAVVCFLKFIHLQSSWVKRKKSMLGTWKTSTRIIGDKKMVKVRWFNRSEEMSSGCGLIIIAKHDLIMTPNVQVVSAECVDGIATVLSPKHYEQCLSIVSQDFSDGIFMRSRQIKKNNINNKITGKSSMFAEATTYTFGRVFTTKSIPFGIWSRVYDFLCISHVFPSEFSGVFRDYFVVYFTYVFHVEFHVFPVEFLCVVLLLLC